MAKLKRKVSASAWAAKVTSTMQSSKAADAVDASVASVEKSRKATLQDGSAAATSLQSLQLADFEIGLVLGRGGYGKIYLARTRRGRFLCALKLVSVAKLEAKEMEAQMLQEIRIQSAAQHEHVLLQYAHFASTSHIYLVLEHAPGGDLHTRLLARGGRGLAHASAALVTRQLSAAVAYCHAMHIIHRDIKAENILFDLAGRVKLGDFGWAVQSSRRRQTYCGTLECVHIIIANLPQRASVEFRYLAPEMVACYRAAAGRSTYDAAVDAWSVGVVLFEMLTGTTPFEVAATPWADATDERRRLRAEVHGRITAATVAFPSARAPSEAARGLALQLLEKDAARRCKVGDVHAHPWIVAEAPKAAPYVFRDKPDPQTDACPNGSPRPPRMPVVRATLG